MIDDTFYKKCYYYESNDFVTLKGLIAASRTIFYGKSKKLILFVGVEKNKYVEIIISGKISYNTKIVLIECSGIKKNNIYNTIEVKVKMLNLLINYNFDFNIVKKLKSNSIAYLIIK